MDEISLVEETKGRTRYRANLTYHIPPGEHYNLTAVRICEIRTATGCDVRAEHNGRWLRATDLSDTPEKVVLRMKREHPEYPYGD